MERKKGLFSTNKQINIFKACAPSLASVCMQTHPSFLKGLLDKGAKLLLLVTDRKQSKGHGLWLGRFRQEIWKNLLA